MPAELTDTDLPPTPPKRPGNDECCHSGCDPCVFELYEDALERYRVELSAWELRTGKKPGDKS
jgi:hypothetical protein